MFALAGYSPVLAHGELKGSSPEAGAHLRVAPRELRLTFTETPELAVARLELLGPDGARIALSPLRLSPDSNTVMISTIMGGLTAGTYTVSWQVAGADGHPVRGTFAFVIAPGAQGLGDPIAPMGVVPSRDSAATHHDPVSMPTSAQGFDAESPAYVGIRFLMYAALLTLIGAVAFRIVVLRLVQRLSDDIALVRGMARRAAAVGFGAAVLLLGSALARLAAQSIALHGNRGIGDLTLVGTLISGTSWGRTWLIQVIATVVALVAFRVARLDRASAAAWSLAATSSLALAFTPAFASHAAASPRLTGLAIVSDGLHVIGAAGWLGSLLLVLAAGIPAALSQTEDRRGASVAHLINAFSPTALVFAGIVSLTGLFAAWLHVGGFAPLWQERYGQLLLAKLAVLSVVTLTGAYNWLRVKPTLGQAEGAVRIRRSARIEVAVGVLILIVTAILVATPTPMDTM
ncbi:MAG: copper resistance protein CopC [Gemmatimonadota bacterium]